MKKRYQKVIQDIEIYRRLLYLNDWDIQLDTEQVAPEQSMAAIAIRYNSHIATIQLGESFFETDENEQRATILHELIHCHTDQILRACESLAPALGSQVWNIFLPLLTEKIETITDTLSLVVRDILLANTRRTDGGTLSLAGPAPTAGHPSR